jgi:rhodanese-related sulfurtransferase
VTYDPDHGLFTKTCTDKKSAAKTKKEVVHVQVRPLSSEPSVAKQPSHMCLLAQFLGHEKPARAWLNTSALQPWADTKEEHLTQKVKERFLPDWQRALDDCEETCELTRAQRIERHAGVFGRADSDDEGDEGDEGEKTDTAEVVAQDKTQIRWTKGMDAKLMKIVLLYGVPKRWKQITSWMGCGLSVKQVQNHWRGMKKWYEKGLLEQKIKEFTAAALAEGIDLEAMDFSTAPAMTSTSQKCQICSNGAGAMLACVGGCGSCFHRVCIGLARTPKAFVCDQCYLNEVSTDDVPSAQLSRSQKAAQRPVTPGTIEADDLVPSEQLADARQKGVSRKRHAPEQERTAKDGDLQEEEEEEEEDADENDDDDELCVVCSSGADSARMLLCDGCDDGYHLDCLSPKMERIPSGLWFCPTCSGARKDCTACNGSQGAHTCGTVGRRDDATGEEKSAAVKRVRTSGATAASGSKKRKTGSFDRVPQPVTRRQDDAAHAAQVESIAALNQSIAGYTDSVLSGGGRSRRASTAASTKATDFLRVAQVVQDQNVSGHQPKEDGKPQQRIAMWSKSKRVVIKGWKAPMKKHLEKFLCTHFIASPCHALRPCNPFLS